MEKSYKKGYLTTCPGLDVSLSDKHLPPSINTAKGHLKQERQHILPPQPKDVDYKQILERIKQQFKTFKNKA